MLSQIQRLVDLDDKGLFRHCESDSSTIMFIRCKINLNMLVLFLEVYIELFLGVTSEHLSSKGLVY